MAQLVVFISSDSTVSSFDLVVSRMLSICSKTCLKDLNYETIKVAPLTEGLSRQIKG